MRTDILIDIEPPQDTGHIVCERGSGYSVLIRRDTYRSSVRLMFVDFETMARFVERVHEQITEFKRLHDELDWRCTSCEQMKP